MDTKIIDFLNGATNVLDLTGVKTKIIVSRERPIGKSQELIHISDGSEDIFQFWRNIKGKKRAPGKTMGGHKPYIMVMTEEVERLRTSGMDGTEEVLGFLVSLAPNIEWKTGRLINKRTKKPLRYDDLKKKYSRGRRNFENLMKNLKNNDLLTLNREGYFISRRLIKKGAGDGADRQGSVKPKGSDTKGT